MTRADHIFKNRVFATEMPAFRASLGGTVSGADQLRRESAMKILELTLVAGLVLTLPVALGGQAYVDFGDHGAAYAKNG